MSFTLIGAAVAAAWALGEAHKAGAGYLATRLRGERPKWSFFRTGLSIVLIGLALWLAHES
jgi:hypothetical protein